MDSAVEVPAQGRQGTAIAVSPAARFAANVSSVVLAAVSRDRPVTFVITAPSCPRPYYVVRLAGPALVAGRRQHHFDMHGNRLPPEVLAYRTVSVDSLDRYDRYDDSAAGQLQFAYNRPDSAAPAVSGQARDAPVDGTVTVIEMYPIPLSGNYSIEILQLSCNATFAAARRDCLPNSWNSLTLNRFPLYTEFPAQTELHHRLRIGYWAYSNGRGGNEHAENSIGSTDHGGNEHSPPFPLVRTRHQPFLNTTCEHGPCDRSWFVDHYSTYEGEPPFDYPDTHGHINRTICFLGASHARNLRIHFDIVLRQHLPSGTHKISSMGYIEFPQRVRQSHIATMIQNNCTDVVIGMAQWALSNFGPKRLDTPEEWQAKMGNVATMIAAADPSVRMYFRNVHYNSLKALMLSCPAKDSRVPYLIESYTEAVRRLFEQHPILSNRSLPHKMIDTNPVMLPVWDTWKDYNHPDREASIAEAKYMLHRMKILDEEPRGETPVDVSLRKVNTPSTMSSVPDTAREDLEMTGEASGGQPALPSPSSLSYLEDGFWRLSQEQLSLSTPVALGIIFLLLAQRRIRRR